MDEMTGSGKGIRKATAGWIAGVVASAIAATALAAGPASAQNKQMAATTANASKTFTVVVFGDSLADGLWAGLYQYFRRYGRNVRVLRETKVSSGFTAYNYQARLEQILRRTKPNLFVVQVGANDRQRMVTRSRKLIRFKTDAWKAIYRERLDMFLARLKKAGIPTYWVGLPIMRDKQLNADSKMLNALYKAATLGHGYTYVSSWQVTANKQGAYSAFLPDAKGRLRRFRAQDGIHFSMIGYGVVARHVMSVVKAVQPDLLAGRISSN